MSFVDDAVKQRVNAQEDTDILFHRNFNSIFRRDHQKNFLRAMSR